MDFEKNENNTSPDFIKQVACMSAMQCFGIVGMSTVYNANSIANIIIGNDKTKGVKLNVIDGDKLDIELFVVMEFGVKASAVAENLIDTVKYNVEKQTGYKVKRVTVNITNVRV